MAVCEICKGTRLKPWGVQKFTTLYTPEECNACGGRGQEREGELEYHVMLYVDNAKVQNFYVMARTAAEALREAAEMLAGIAPNSLRGNEEAALVVVEHV